MSRKVLLDTNLLIGAFDGQLGNAAHESARQRLTALLADPGVKLAITPLIRYEVLRGVRDVDLVGELNAVLNDFHEFEVRGAEARRAADVFRRARATGVNLDKRSFDIFHCVCAELNGFEIDSQDGDIPKIQQLIQAGPDHA